MKVGYGVKREREEPAGFLASVKEWMEIPFAENRALEDHEACDGWGGRQEEKNNGTQNVL